MSQFGDADLEGDNKEKHTEELEGQNLQEDEQKKDEDENSIQKNESQIPENNPNV